MTEIVFWVALGVIILSVVLMIAGPMLRAGLRMGGDRRADYDVAVFRDQLTEVDRDQDAGRLNPTEAAAAKVEIERRMLRALDGRAESALQDAAADASGRSVGPAFPLAMGVVVAGAAVALYLNLGQPDQPDAPLAKRADIPDASETAARRAQATQESREMIARLRQRLAADPNDIGGWVTLARTYRAMRQHRESADAFRNALQIAGQNASAELISDYGESLVMESFGTVSPRAVTAFESALKADPRDIKGRFYIATARAQAGDFRGAIALWRGLTADAPPDAPWLPAVRERISQAAMQAGVIPIQIPPERPGADGGLASGAGGARGAIAGGANPTAEDVKAAQEMSPEDQQAFIRSMVDRLAEKMEANPDDVNGWMRLGRAYQVLEEEEDAARAFGRAKTRLEDLLANMPSDSPTRPGVEATLKELQELMDK